MSLIVRPINLLDSVTVYNQTKTTYQGKITTKTLGGKTVVGPPLVKYRNTFSGPENIAPLEIVISANDRLFAMTAEASGLINIAAYNLENVNGDVTYLGKIVIQVPEPPTTTYAVRGFRVVDTGTTGWKIFILFTANVAAHNGLYMVNDVDLADFTFVPPTFLTATAPNQKAVYKLDNTPFDLTNGAGISVDVANTKLYVHRGVANAHSFLRYDYSLPITTVGGLGATTELYEYETGSLPLLTGTLLLSNSEEFTTPTAGPNAGQPCVIFHTSSTMYRGRLSDLTSGTTLWPSLEFANNLGNINEFISVSTVRAAFSESEQKVVLLSSSSATPATVIIKDFQENQHDIVCTLVSPNSNEQISRDVYKFKSPIAFVGFDSKNGYLAGISATTGARGIYTAAFDVDDIFDNTSIISPVIDIKNEQVFRFTAGFVKPEFASPIVVCYRTSGFGDPDGGWIKAPEDLDFGGIGSPSGFIQIKITYKVFINDSTNGLQIYSAGLITRSPDAISDFWEYTHKDSSPTTPSRAAFRLKKTYPSVVPTLFFRARDLDNNIYVQGNTSVNADRFEYSTDNGISWVAVGTIPNVEGTLLRYNIETPPGVDVRPSLRED